MKCKYYDVVIKKKNIVLCGMRKCKQLVHGSVNNVEIENNHH